MTYPEWKKSFVTDEPKSIEKSNAESYNGGIERACQRALEYGQRTGNELLCWADMNGNTPYPDLSGNSNSVQFTQDLIDYLNRAPEKSLACIHNHPSSSSFSDADLGIMAGFPSIERMRVIGHDGTEYVASIGSGVRPAFDDICDEMKRAIDDLMSEFRPQVISGELSQTEAWKEHTHKAMQEVAKKYKWKYERRLPNEKE
jgi:hypothetical protein